MLLNLWEQGKPQDQPVNKRKQRNQNNADLKTREYWEGKLVDINQEHLRQSEDAGEYFQDACPISSP
jgi:hypothetical protein